LSGTPAAVKNWYAVCSAEYVARRDEGLLSPTRPPRKGLPRINTLPTTDTHRRRLCTKTPKMPKPFGPTVKPVAEIVPQKAVAKIKPLPS
jgi:hypothetical protein